jgi:hypothetical protein
MVGLTDLSGGSAALSDGRMALLAFFKSEALHPADFRIRDDGVVGLNRELARRVAGLRYSAMPRMVA